MADNGIEGLRRHRLGTGAVHDPLDGDILRAGQRHVAVERLFGDGGHGGATFQDFEAIGRDQKGGRRHIDAVVRAADALQQARYALGRADLDDDIDIAPVDTEFDRRGGDQRPQLAVGHHGDGFQSHLARQRGVVDGDRQGIVIGVPQELEQQFGLGAGIDEDDGGFRLADLRHDLGHGILRHEAGIGHGFFRFEDRHLRRFAGRGTVEMRHRVTGGTQPVAKDLGLRHRGRQADAAKAGRIGFQLRQGQRDQVAAL